MKAKLAGKNNGFSTLEIMIALAIISIALVGALSANYGAQYWSVTSQTSNEALYKAKTKLEDLRSLAKQDFYQVVSSPLTRSDVAGDPNDVSCHDGGLCYFVETNITDLSSCSKYAKTAVSWQVDGYATSTISLFTNLTNANEAVALGGDCILNQPAGNWASNAPQSVVAFAHSPGRIFTSIDVLHKKIYATASTSPYFLIFDPNTPDRPIGSTFVDPDPSSEGSGIRLNDVDVEEDLSNGRSYAFASENATTSQLAVFNVTNPAAPYLVIEKQLNGVDPYGGSPQGWKVFVYGSRLYMTTRYTVGNEFHIFNIEDPTQPVEIGDGFELGRTVNDMVVRDQKVGGITHRFVFLAAKSDTKALGVLDVTNDIITELPIAIAGVPDGDSLSLLGHNLYLGTESSGGAELYVYDVTNPAGALPLLGSVEVGADVTTIRVSGAYAYLGTRSGGQGKIEVWNSDPENLIRHESYDFQHLTPIASYGTPFGKGFDIDGNWIYAISQSKTGDALQVLYTP